MNYSLLLSAIDKEAMGTGGIIVLLGILIVFVVLFLLIGLLKLISPMTKIEYSEIIGGFFRKALSKVAYGFKFLYCKIAKKPISKPESGSAAAKPALTISPDADDETVAAITAAISVVLHSEEPYEKQAKFVVRSIKQI